MIDMNKTSAQKRKPGRPPKVKTRAEEGEEDSARLHETPRKDGPFVFKSKYREDVVWLESPREERRPDGSRFVSPGEKLEFHRNTKTIYDPLTAQKLRDKIKEQTELGNPLHIVETTP